MNIVCLDMEGVLVPEIWIAFAEESGIPELKRTTRDEPDYDKLMHWRIGILNEHGLGLKEIQAVIAKIDPLPGAKDFLDELRHTCQTVILSDTFEEFAKPLMEKLDWPTIFCNRLLADPGGTITGFQMRCEKSKQTTVKALQAMGYEFEVDHAVDDRHTLIRLVTSWATPEQAVENFLRDLAACAGAH